MSRPSSALVATRARAMVSKGTRTSDSRSNAGSSVALADARAAISMQPPPAGIRPTPTSTQPMYSSAAARTFWQPSTTSAPPPRANPNGAATTGTRA